MYIILHKTLRNCYVLCWTRVRKVAEKLVRVKRKAENARASRLPSAAGSVRPAPTSHWVTDDYDRSPPVCTAAAAPPAAARRAPRAPGERLRTEPYSNTLPRVYICSEVFQNDSTFTELQVININWFIIGQSTTLFCNVFVNCINLDVSCSVIQIMRVGNIVVY